MNMDIEDPIKTTVEEIRKVLNIENVIGNPIETDDKVLIPVTMMGMGFGAGMGEGKGMMSSDASGAGAGAGGAAGIKPVAMIVVFKNISGPEGVKVLTLSANPLAQALGEIGSEVMSMMKEKCTMKKDSMKEHKKGKEEAKPEAKTSPKM